MPVSGSRFRHRLPWPGLLLAGILQAGCASTGSERSEVHPGYGDPSAASALSNEVLMRAISLVGTPYRTAAIRPKADSTAAAWSIMCS